MNKLKKRLLIVGGITLIIALAFFGVIVKMLIENGKCVDDPFGYSAQRLEESGGMYSCYCDSYDPKLLDFSFDKNGIKIIEETPLTYSEINFENIIIEKAG